MAFTEKVRAGLKNWDAAGIYYFNPFDLQAHPEAVDFAPVIIQRKIVHEKHGRHRSSKTIRKKAAKSRKAGSQLHKSKLHKKRK